VKIVVKIILLLNILSISKTYSCTWGHLLVGEFENTTDREVNVSEKQAKEIISGIINNQECAPDYLFELSGYFGENIIFEFLKTMTDISDVNMEHSSVLHGSASAGYYKSVRYILERDPSLINSKSSGIDFITRKKVFSTLLSSSLFSNSLETVDLILNKKPEDLWVRDFRNKLPIEVAVIMGNDDIVALMLKKEPSLIKFIK
jgi:hypothetical protein